MPIKSKRVNLSISPSKEKPIMNVGRQNKLQAPNRSLSLTTICTKIVYFFVDLHGDETIDAYLRKHGGTLFDLIRRAIKQYISDET